MKPFVDTVELKRKRLKVGNESNLFKHLRTQEQQHPDGRKFQFVFKYSLHANL